MSETKASFAESTPQSLKNVFYRYLEDYGYRYIHQLSQFVRTPNYKKNCSIDLMPKNNKNSAFLSILYSKPLREYRKPRNIIGDRVRIARYDLPFTKGYLPQFKREVFEFVPISPGKPPIYIMKDAQDEIIRGKFCQKEVIEVFLQRNHLQQCWFQLHLRNYFQTIS